MTSTINPHNEIISNLEASYYKIDDIITCAAVEPIRFSLSEAFFSFPRQMRDSNLSLNLNNIQSFIKEQNLTQKNTDHEEDSYHILSPSSSGQQKLNKAHNSYFENQQHKNIQIMCWLVLNVQSDGRKTWIRKHKM